MKRFLLGMTVVVCCVAPTQAALIAGWNFNDDNLDVDHGAGTLTTTVPGANQNYFSGTTLNAYSGDPAGNAFSPASNVNNGANLTFAINTAGMQDLILTLATRRTSTGFNNNQLAYSPDGGQTFFDFGSPYNPNDTIFEVLTFDLSSIASLNDNTDVQIRITINGATGSGGNNRFDNVQFNAVPEPTTLALLVLGGLTIHRRRR